MGDFKAFLREVKQRGWEVETTGGNHIRLRHPDGGLVFTGSTPGDYRSIANTRAEVKRQEAAMTGGMISGQNPVTETDLLIQNWEQAGEPLMECKVEGCGRSFMHPIGFIEHMNQHEDTDTDTDPDVSRGRDEEEDMASQSERITDIVQREGLITREEIASEMGIKKSQVATVLSQAVMQGAPINRRDDGVVEWAGADDEPVELKPLEQARRERKSESGGKGGKKQSPEPRIEVSGVGVGDGGESLYLESRGNLSDGRLILEADDGSLWIAKKLEV